MTYALECEALNKRYGTRSALTNLTVHFEQGRIIGLLGPNGSGKTTLLKLAAGLLVPSGGSIRVVGHEPGVETKGMVAYLPDRMALPAYMRTADVMDFYQDFFADFDTEKAKSMLADLGIGPKDKIGAMSKGTQEKLQLVLTMSRAAKLYLLDEPIGGVDPAAREYILNTIIRNYSEDATLILSTHLIEDIEKILDDVVFLQNGQVSLAQSVDSVREEYGKSVDAVFSLPARVLGLINSENRSWLLSSTNSSRFLMNGMYSIGSLQPYSPLAVLQSFVTATLHKSRWHARMQLSTNA